MSSEVRQEDVNSLRLHLERAISDSERKILKDLRAVIDAAVDSKYKIVIARLSADSKSSNDSWIWESVKLILPILLTIALGYWVFLLQKNVEQKIDLQKQNLTTRLALTQEYYRRKVEVYELCAKDMSTLLEGIELLRVDRNDQKQAFDATHKLYECTTNNPLYISQELAKALSKLRTDSIASLESARGGRINSTAIQEDIEMVEQRMKNELQSARVPLEVVN